MSLFDSGSARNQTAWLNGQHEAARPFGDRFFQPTGAFRQSRVLSFDWHGAGSHASAFALEAQCGSDTQFGVRAPQRLNHQLALELNSRKSMLGKVEIAGVQAEESGGETLCNDRPRWGHSISHDNMARN